MSLKFGQMSLASVNQMCVIHEAMNGCKNLKDSLKDCFENVNISLWPVHEISVLITSASREGFGESVHMRRLALARTFLAYIHLFGLILYVPVIFFSVMSGWVFLGLTR